MSNKKIKTVQVKAEDFAGEQIVVIFKKIVAEHGPARDLSNNYFFNDIGITDMLERDAILFWKIQKKVNAQIEIQVSYGDTIYEFEKVKDTYEVEEVELATSQPV